MRINREGEEIQQVSIWLPVPVLALARADHLNLSQFVREQLEELYGEQSTIESLNRKVRLVETARGSLARQREIAEAEVENRERLRTTVRQRRAERRAGEDEKAARTAGIRDAIQAVAGESLDRFWRALPENDTFGDRIDDWDALVAGVSRRCGAAIDDAEVAVELRRCVARELAGGEA